MRLYSFIPILVIIISLDSCQSQEKLEYPDFYIEKTDLMPDLLMTDKRLGLPEGGGYFCGPVSVVNSLIYLQKNRFEKLLPDFQSDTMRIYGDLIRRLGEDKYMKTITNKITPSDYMIRGLKRYVKDSDYDIEDIQYREFGKNSTYDIDWLKKYISNGHEIMIFLWITKEVEPNTMKIVAGHWVSLAGYGKDENGVTNPEFLIIHDPGSGFDYNKNDFVKLKLHDSDFIADKQNFKNHYELMDYDCTNGADNIFLSGMLSFKLKQ
jgi:hypothetical protein